MASKFTITAELNLQTKNLGQTVNNLKQQFKGMDVNIKVKDLAAAESSIRNISKEAKSATQSMGLLGSSIGMAFKRFAAVTLATGTIVGFTRAVKNAVGDAISFEREIVKIAQATGKTVAQLKTLGNEVGNVATNFGVSSKELLSAARSLTQAGFAADKVTGALKILAQTELAATFDSIGDTTEGVIALLNQFGRTAQRTGTEIDFLEKSLSAINQVSKEFAVESSDLITVIRTTGSAFESAGGSLDELLALFTSVRATTRESAESIATGFRTIFTRVQRVDTINALRDLGIELQDAEGKFVGPMEAAKRLSVALSTIDPKDFRFNMVVEELGGFRQVSKVIPLIQQFGVAQKALNVAQGSSGSLAKDAQTAQQSLAVQIQKTREEFLRFVRDLTESSSFQNTAKFLLEIANAFIRVADTMKPLIPLIASFGALKIGQAFLPSIKGFLGTKKAQGGKIHAFASGGLVPGQGNGDTVPAMLTPGEFVIKKSSVKSLGVDNLARANKYAKGGPVQFFEEGGKPKKLASRYRADTKPGSVEKFVSGRGAEFSTEKEIVTGFKNNSKLDKEYGAVFLRPGEIDDDINGFIDPSKIANRYISSKNIQDKDKKNYYGDIISDQYKKGINFKIHSSSLSKDFEDSFQESLLGDIAHTVDSNAKKLLGSIPGIDKGIGEGSTYEILKKSNLDQTLGNIFEATIKTASGLFANDSGSGAGNQPFDFPNGLGNAASAFTKPEQLKKFPSDAKTSFSSASIASLINKVSDTLSTEAVSGFIEKQISSGQLSTVFQNASGKPLKALQSNPLIQTVSGQSNLKANDIEELAKKYGFNTTSKNGLYSFTKFANGGFASGSDTVPAMLTPGEFVINKKSAESIGYSSLNKMNKVGKFAKGGPVQYLAGGGQASFDQGQQQMQKALFIPKIQPLVSPGQLKTIEKIVDDYIKDNKDAEAVMKAIVRDLENQKKQTGQVKIGKPLIERAERAATRNGTLENKKVGPPKDKEAEGPKLSDKLKALGDSTDNTSTKFLIMAGVAESVVSQMSGLSEEVKNAASAFGATFATYMAIGSSLKDLGINIAASIAQKREEKIAQKNAQMAMEAQNAAIKRNAMAFDAHSAKLNGKGGGGLDASGKAAPGGGKLAKGMAIFDGALMGFSVAMGIAAAATEYYATLARKAGKELDDTVAKFKKDSTSVSQGELSNKFSKALNATAKADSLARKTQGAAGVGIVAGGAAIGAGVGFAVGGPLGAAIGGVVGALAGLAINFARYQLDINGSFENIQKSANNLSSSLYESVTATVKARKFLEKIDTKSTEDVFSELNSTTNSYVSSLDKAIAGEAAAIAAYGSLEAVPEQFKKSIDEVRQSAMELKQELDKIVAANTGKKVKELAAKIGTTNFDVVKDITAFVDSQQTNMSKSSFSETKANYSGRFAELQAKGADTSSLDIKVMNLSVVKAAHAAEELKLSLLEASLQVVAQKEAILKEKAIRDKLIGTLIEQQAFDTAFSNFKFSLDKITSEVDNIAAVYSGSVTGLKSAIPDSSILDVKNPMGDNAKDFNDALGVISSIGPAGQKLSSTISDLNKTMPKFEVALNSVNSVDFSKFFDPKTGKDAVEKFIGGLGIDTKGAVAEAMRDSFAQAADTANMKQGEGLSREDRTKKIFDTFNDIAKINSERGKQVLEVFKASEAKAQAIQEAINQSRERQLELELSNADAYEALQKNIAQARGRSMSLAEGDQLRGNRQRILAGNLGGNAKAIGAELANIRDQLKRGVGNQGDLQNKSKKLTKALEELANQSGRTSEIMSKIEEAKAKRETARDFAKDFVFGTNEQRDTMQKDISNARTAAQQGNLSSVAEEDRAGVGAMFERFKDLPIFNGMTGRQAQNKVIANEVRASGGGEDMARMIEQDMSSPEEKLIQELKNTADSEMAARQELFNKEEENIKENMTALDNNTAALKSFVDNLATAKANAETAKAEVEKNQDKAPDVKALEEQRKNLTAEIEKTKINIDKFAGKIRELTDAIDFAIKKMYQDIENRGTAEKGAREGNQVATNLKAKTDKEKEYSGGGAGTDGGGGGFGSYAKGGLVYLAKGGDVFKPQGTDTVPAMLTPGEFVVKKSSVDKIGSDKLNQLNQGGDVKAFAKGGLVSYLQMGGLASFNGDVIDKLSKRVTKLEKETKKLKQENESLKTKIEETEQVGGVRNQMQNVQNMTGNIATNQQQQQQSLPEYGNRPMRGTRSQIRARQAAMRRQSDDIFKEEGFDQNNSNTTTTIDRRGTKDQVRARERALKRRDGKDIAEEIGLGPETAVKPVNTATQAPVSEYDKLHQELINPRTTAARSREIMARQSELEKLTAQEQDRQTQGVNDRVTAAKAETSATVQNTLDASKYGDVPESPFTTAALNDIEKRYAEKSANVDKEISDANAQGLAIGQKKMAEAMQFNERQVPQEKLYEQEEMMAQLESVGVNSNPAEYTYGEVVDKQMAELKAKYDAESARALDANDGELAGRLGQQYTKDRMALESNSDEGLTKVKGTGEGVDAEGNVIDTTYGVFDGHRMPAHEAQALMNKRMTAALIEKNQTPVDENGNPLEGNKLTRGFGTMAKIVAEGWANPLGKIAMRNSGIAAQFGVDRVSTQEEVNKRIDDEAKKPMTKAQLADVRHGIRMDQLSRGQLGSVAAGNTRLEQAQRELTMFDSNTGLGDSYRPEDVPVSKTQTVSTPEEVDAQLKVHQDRYKAMGLHLGGVVSYLARGGSSRGSDTVPAMLTPGEFVMNKDSVSKYGTSFMEKMNKGGVVPGFANGGAVGQRSDAQTTAVQQSPVKTVVDSATPREQPAPKMMDDGLFARSVESLNTIASTFSSFTETLQGLVSQFAGITVKHTMTVDGNLAITGVDPATIGKTIADALMKSIGDETLKQIQTKQDQKQGPKR
jgi:hypothetical protein